MNSQQKRFLGLASRISLSIVILGALIFVAVIGANYLLSRSILENYIASLAQSTASSTANEIEAIFNSVSNSADTLSQVIAQKGFDDELIHSSIKAFLNTTPDIYGSTVAFEPGVLYDEVGEYSPYYYQSSEGLGYADLADENYQYLTWDWYQEPKSQGQAIWTEPYNDEGGGNVLMITYSTLIRNPENIFAGIATADIALGWLQQLVENIHIGETGYGMIVSNQDTIVAHPDQTWNMRPLQELIDRAAFTQIRQAADDQQAAYINMPCWDSGGQCWVAIEPLTEAGWKVLTVVPESELVSDIFDMTGKIALIAIIGLALLVAVIIWVTHRSIRPLGQLTTVTNAIGSGDLDIELPDAVHGDEIGVLTKDFSRMRDSLRVHIEQLKEATARQQKLESEFEIASDIQMSMVPGSGQILLNSQKHQIYATLKPARSVGGDLYYLQQEDNLLSFIIGDVSGKGVPAALFMAKAITLYTGEVQSDNSPGDILAHMNNALTQDNNACMFVTALCGTLELDTGKLCIANAGHMHPILKSPDETKELIVESSAVLGIMEDMEYPDTTFTLPSGTAMVMYTDGISEAFDNERNEYQTERLLECLKEISAVQADVLGESVMQDIEQFVGDAEQSDDITLMVIKYSG